MTRRTFGASRREQAERLSVLDLEIDRVDRDQVAEPPRQIPSLQNRHSVSSGDPVVTPARPQG
jgi:hypothetical protein